jgi:hypothetical protein
MWTKTALHKKQNEFDEAKEKLVDILIESDWKIAIDQGSPDWIESCLRDGFQGYRHMTTEQLQQELDARGYGGKG